MKIGITSVVATLGLVGLLASCASPNLGLTPKISGSVGGYSGGEKTIKVRAGSTVIATGILKADGSFSVDLPVVPTASLSTLAPLLCSSGTSSVNPPTAQSRSVVANVFDTPSSLTASGSLTQTEVTPPIALGVKYVSVIRIFVDVDVVVTASNCVLGGSPISGTWTLKAGWNEVNTTEEVTSISPLSSRTTFSMGTAGKPWRIDTSNSAPFNSLLIRQ